MRSRARWAVLVPIAALFAARARAADERLFAEPFTVKDVFRPVMVDAGDFDGDGKLDLVTASGSDSIRILLQDSADRTTWRASDLKLGIGSYFVRAADIDADGLADLIVADPATSAFVVRSVGGGLFADPVPLADARQSRWVTLGDWNSDGKLDLASANHDQSTISVFAGDGAGSFALTEMTRGDDAHAIETTDYDGNGNLDLALAVGTAGAAILSGRGDGKFAGSKSVAAFGCARYMATGDFNADGKGDLVLICDSAKQMTVAIGAGDGTYKDTLQVGLPEGIETPAVGDLDGDGAEDVAVPVKSNTGIAVHLGDGAGGFAVRPPFFGPIGAGASFFISRDLDADGRKDLVCANTGVSSLTILWGRGQQQFLASARILSFVSQSRAIALTDWDQDGRADLFRSPISTPAVEVTTDVAGERIEEPPLSIKTDRRYAILEVLDLDEDGVPDLVGADASSLALVSLLDAGGNVREEISLPAASLPSAIAVGRLDENATLDLALPCRGADQIAVFLGQGGGKFDAARLVPTTPSPKGAAIVDLDRDGLTDLVVVSTQEVVAHYSTGGGSFSGPQKIAGKAANDFVDAATGDVSDDGIPDLVVVSAGAGGLLTVLRGKGARQFEGPSPLQVGIGSLNSLLLFDADRDGRLDISVSSHSNSSVSMLRGKGSGAFSTPEIYLVGAVELEHRITDVNRDGRMDLLALSSRSTTVLLGQGEAKPNSSLFRRGDMDGDGKIAISDPILVLGWLFRGFDSPLCPDAADSDDDGLINLTDPIRTLTWLFKGGDALPPPGPTDCGADLTPDDLGECRNLCRA